MIFKRIKYIFGLCTLELVFFRDFGLIMSPNFNIVWI